MQAVQLAAHGAQGGHLLGDLRRASAEAGVAVEEIHVFARAQQREVLALAVDVDQRLADVLQDAGGHGAAVDARRAAARAVDLAAEDDAAVFRRQAILVEQARQVGRGG